MSKDTIHTNLYPYSAWGNEKLNKWGAAAEKTSGIKTQVSSGSESYSPTSIKESFKRVGSGMYKLFLGAAGIGFFAPTLVTGTILAGFAGAVSGTIVTGIGGLIGGVRGKATFEDKHGAQFANIGATVHNKIKDKTHSNVLAIAGGVPAGIIGDAMQGGVETSRLFFKEGIDQTVDVLSSIARFMGR